MRSYSSVYQRSLDHPEAFWEEAAEAIHWDARWTKALDDSNVPFYRWFVGGRLNTSFSQENVATPIRSSGRATR